jgi:hypothetical protein
MFSNEPIQTGNSEEGIPTPLMSFRTDEKRTPSGGMNERNIMMEQNFPVLRSALFSQHNVEEMGHTLYRPNFIRTVGLCVHDAFNIR